MDRRTFLAGACGGLVAASGCLDFDSSTPFVTDSEIDVHESGCGDKQSTASLDYDSSTDQLHLDGVLSKTTQCGDLAIAHLYDEPSDKTSDAYTIVSDRVMIEILVSETEDCSSCTRYYDFEATLSFREPPGTMVVVYTDSEQPGGWVLEPEGDTPATDTS